MRNFKELFEEFLRPRDGQSFEQANQAIKELCSNKQGLLSLMDFFAQGFT